MTKNRRNEYLVAAVLVAPFVLIFGWMFIYPTLQMVQLSFTKSPLIGAGTWVGFDNYVKMFGDKLFWTAIWNTSYFVLLTVVPGTSRPAPRASPAGSRSAIGSSSCSLVVLDAAPANAADFAGGVLPGGSVAFALVVSDSLALVLVIGAAGRGMEQRVDGFVQQDGGVGAGRCGGHRAAVRT